jgi:hypothetical protein
MMVARFPWRRYMVLAGGIVVLTLAPMLVAFGAYAIAGLNSCELNEGAVTPCIVLGADIGSILYTMGVMGWLGLMTLPVSTPALLALLVILIVHLVVHRRRNAG